MKDTSLGIAVRCLSFGIVFTGSLLVMSVPTFSNEAADTNGGSSRDYEEFVRDSFVNPTSIDNEWMPLKPGARWTWEGTTVDDDEVLPHRVVFTVTDLTKVIDGVQTVVCWDQDFSEGELVEAEIVFFAQAANGSIWHFGQYPEEYEDGKFVEAPAWIHGIGDGRAGIMMTSAPKLGAPSYSQGWAPSVDWTDRATVYQVGQETCVPLDCYKDVLVIDETSRSEPDAHQLKYYARGVGNVRVGWRGEGEQTQETLELVKFEMLGPKELEKARRAALALEKRAYEVSQDVYGHTEPCRHTPVKVSN